MESYNGKLYVGTFDIGSLAYPLMQVTNGDILKRSPEEWKTQFEYIIKLLELLKSSGSLAARSATGISSMSATLTSMTSLLYVLTDFDTIEKAFSGAKAAEKGSK